MQSVGIFLLGLILTEFWCYFLTSRKALALFADIPNERSSHQKPVARGGGAAFFVCILIGTFLAFWDAQMSSAALAVVFLAFIPLAIVGFKDDLKPVPAAIRLFIHTLSTAVLILGLPWLYLTASAASLPVAGYALLVVFTLASINFFNFADGINGYVALSSALILLMLGLIAAFHPGEVTLLQNWLKPMVCLGGSLVAFLRHNVLRKTVFMGDVGSTTLGLFQGLLCILLTLNFFLRSPGSSRLGSSFFPCLAAVLICLSFAAWIYLDCTAMVIAKFLNKFPLARAHREHLYQRLHRKFSARPNVTLALLCLSQWAVGNLVVVGLFHLSIRTALWAVFIFALATFFLTQNHRAALNRLSQTIP